MSLGLYSNGQTVTCFLYDIETNKPIEYAHVKYQGTGTLSNLDGVFSIDTSLVNEFEISALGYHSKSVFGLDSDMTSCKIGLERSVIELPEVSVEGKVLNAEDIVKAAIYQIENNYLQEDHNVDLFFRDRLYTENDSLISTLESIIAIYDPIGYHKKGWRKIANTRFAKLLQARRLKEGGAIDSIGDVHELRSIFTLWTSLPILDRKGALSIDGLDGYSYDLLSVELYDGEEVYKISFDAHNLKERFTGMPSMIYDKGVMYINSSDYAVLRIDKESQIDYSYKNKLTKKNWGGGLRRVYSDNDIYIFDKSHDKYIFQYAKLSGKHETYYLKEGEVPQKSLLKTVGEYQFFNLVSPAEKIIDSNLFQLNPTAEYDEAFWKSYNNVLKD